MAAAIASPAAIFCSSRRNDQIFRYSASFTGATFSFAVFPFHESSSSIKICSFLGNFRRTSDTFGLDAWQQILHYAEVPINFTTESL